MKKIVQIGDPVLNRRASEVVNTSATEIKKIVDEMQSVLETEQNGVALAAPQIGESLRIFVIAPHAYEYEKKEIEQLVFINPTIMQASKHKDILEEGCLSIRGKFGMVPRHSQVTVHAYDLDGNGFTINADGLVAQIVQHEIDHLNGALFIEKEI